jgi:hypothetical protein
MDAAETPPAYVATAQQQQRRAFWFASTSKDVSWAMLDVHLRISALNVPQEPSAHAGAMFGTSLDWIIPTKRIQNYRSRLDLGIGGGGGGLEGVVAGSFGFGLRAPFGEQHGPFARVGVGFRYQGNDHFLTSMLEMPEGRVGYQLMTDSVGLEIGPTVGPVLVGALKSGYGGSELARDINPSLSYGGTATLMVRGLAFGLIDIRYTGLRFDFEFLRIQANTKPETPVDQARGHFCFVDFVAICADGAWMKGDGFTQPAGPLTPSQEMEPTYFGMSIGLGAIFGERLTKD